MRITPRRVVLTILGGAAGAALGASHILCPTGECAITGSWYGTGAIGAILAFLYADGCPACAVADRFATKPGNAAAAPPDDELDSLRPHDDDPR